MKPTKLETDTCRMFVSSIIRETTCCHAVSVRKLAVLPEHARRGVPKRQVAARSLEALCSIQATCPTAGRLRKEMRSLLPCGAARKELEEFLGKT